MATIYMWPVKSSVSSTISYVRNPKKTIEAACEDLEKLHFAADSAGYVAGRTRAEHFSYVTCLNCRMDIAAAQFMETKRLWGKLGGRMCYHGYQSFKAGEVTAETAHEIGVKLARELWGDRFEVVVATHCNTSHYHNHFVFNSVSFRDGIKFINTYADLFRMWEVSNRLCREYDISVLENSGRRIKSYTEWQAERNGRLTLRGTIRADIDRAVLASTTERDFLRVMSEMGYQFKLWGQNGEPLKHPALKPPDAKEYFCFHKLGEGYTLDEIKERILHNLQKQVPFPEMMHRPPRRYRIRGKPRKKVTGLRALYVRYCYELHTLVKRPTSVRRVSFLLREDMVRLDRLDQETQFLVEHRISTIEELTAHRETASAEIDSLTAQRQELRKELQRFRRQGDTISVDKVKGKISAISSRLKVLRKEVALCDGIAQRSGQVRENLGRLVQQKEIERKELTQHELLRRRGGAGREDVPGNR